MEKLITSPTLGIARMKRGWKNLGVTPIRILSVETNESHGDSRFVHIAVTEPVVEAIKKMDGIIHVRAGRASVRYKNRQLCPQVVVEYNHA